jgi:hypothetical protein
MTANAWSCSVRFPSTKKTVTISRAVAGGVAGLFQTPVCGTCTGTSGSGRCRTTLVISKSAVPSAASMRLVTRSTSAAEGVDPVAITLTVQPTVHWKGAKPINVAILSGGAITTVMEPMSGAEGL